MFTIYPAIDMRKGRVVRLIQGRAEDERIYSNKPAEMAVRWAAEGAAWLHVVNLDGAFGEADNLNADALRSILATTALPVQFGGGLRDVASIRRAFELGVARVIIGTAAVQQPEVVSDALDEFGAERVSVAIEARDGKIAARGWVAATDIQAIDFGIKMRGLGVTRALVTDIARDGMMQGIDAQAMAAFARETGLTVIAAGGVATLQDIDALVEVAGEGVEGVNVGQALYTGAFTLREALGRVAALEGASVTQEARSRRPRYCEG